tara:strand:- start:18844 stop:20223 length:1380 start_codon:yes stop_codon:yes gene_type:complete
MKRSILLLLGLICSCLLSAQNFELEFFKDGFSDPVDIQNAGDDRLFVVEQDGLIKIIQPNGTVNPTPFLDISGLVSGASEQGLLGLAFHPDYQNNGFFYVNYTKIGGTTRIARFSVDPGDPDIALPGSELEILEYAQPFPNHNGGGIAFGPDGYLYIASGDGGSGGDPGNRAQNTTILLGKLLRLDIDTPGAGAYTIPPTNPFAGHPTNAEEIWAYGLRNPWRFSFDSLTGDLWIGDVGQGDVEEINKADASAAGLNYGWRCYEGSQPFNTGGCPPMSELTFPIGEYSSSTGTPNCSVTGGMVYRGSDHPSLDGYYFFGDVCSGLIGTIDENGTLVEHGTFGGSWVAFGEDVNNELYIVSIGGTIYKIVEDPTAGTPSFDAPLISIVPNPASDEVSLNIENTEITSVEIIDLKGSVLISEENISASEKNIKIETLSQGIYLVRITTADNNSFIKKLIVE